MPSTTRSPREFGPIQLISTSLSRQLLGFLLTFVGIQLISWAFSKNTVPSSTIIYTVIGTFVILNGLYLGGVRPR
ncbi:hypothetical protein DMJ13_26205 [halophilic archaeon]|nr:hypothetical protein DMJ13_26205 [halophilic archaeon]